MTKRNLIIVIILLSVIDLVAAGWYFSRRIETGDNSDDLFNWRDTTDVVVEADTLVSTFEPDEFDKLQHNTYYFIANTPSVSGDKSTCYTSIKHVKVRWPIKINGNAELEKLNKELISKAFGNTQARLKDARYVYLNTPAFNKPIDGDDYHSMKTAPAIVPLYGNVSQVLVYPYMTSNRLLVMEVDKVEYNGHATVEDEHFIHYDRVKHRVLSRVDILNANAGNENKLLKLINKKIDNLNRGRSDSNHLQHALNVPAELCCGKDGIVFLFRQGSIANTPIEVKIGYDDLKPCLASGFEQLLDNNDAYHVYNENIKPEPVNATQRTSSTSNAMTSSQSDKAVATSSSKSYSGSYKKKSSGNYKKSRYYRKGNGYYRKSGGNGYNNSGNAGGSGQQQSLKQGYKSSKRYSGAKRKAGRHGQFGKRRWNHRRR